MFTVRCIFIGKMKGEYTMASFKIMTRLM
ncbi:hypothetical protein S091751_0632 [Staphylococcus aureus subsp. aureus 091751]|nr:hypothetical protein S091751_0632 [Staphylococcus aureus subsp. aureus 091751]